MELNRKIIKWGLIFIGISLILTMVLAMAYKLENPVFLKMYIQESIYSNENSESVNNFELKYITNISDKRKVVGIDFKEEPNIQAIVSDNHLGGISFSSFYNNNPNEQRGEVYGRYLVNTVYLDLNLSNINKNLNQFEINNMKIRFDDGSTLDTNIGRIILQREEMKHENTDYSNSGAGSSSDGTAFCEYIINKDIKLLSMDSILLNELEEYFQISVGEIDYKEILGAKYEKDTMLIINSKWKFPKSIAQKYSYYNIHPKLYYEDDKGNKGYIPIYNIKHRPYSFDLKEIFNYLKSRGEI